MLGKKLMLPSWWWWGSFIVLNSFIILSETRSDPYQASHDDQLLMNVGQKKHSRQKRFIFFNTATPVDIGFIITLPLSFALPTFNLQTSRRFRRESPLHSDDHLNYLHNMTSDDILPKGSYDDAAYGQELNKMSAYFHALEVEEDICQQRILCEIFTDADNYRPLSDLFMKKLTVDRGIVHEKSTNRYFRYVQAMQDGMVTGDKKKCGSLYARCPYSAEDRLHMEALKFWTFLTSSLRLEFRDE